MDKSHTWGQRTCDRGKIWVFGMKKQLENEVAPHMLSSDSQRRTKNERNIKTQKEFL